MSETKKHVEETRKMIEFVGSENLRTLLNALTKVSGEIISKSGLETHTSDTFHRNCQVMMKKILKELYKRDK